MQHLRRFEAVSRSSEKSCGYGSKSNLQLFFNTLLINCRYQRHNQQVSAIMELVEQRQRIESKMMDVVSRMHAVVEQVEIKMLAGYDRREANVKASRFARAKHRRYV